MRSKFKKMLTYFLLSAIILPGWVLGSSLFQKPESAKAAVAGDQILDDSAGSPDFVMANSANWTSETTGYNSSSKTTDGTHANEAAYWRFYPDGDGHNLIMVSWVVSADRADNVTYGLFDHTFASVKDLNGDKYFTIDQTKNNSGQTVADGTWSGYKMLSIYDLNQYEEYSLAINGENSNGSVNADSVFITYDSIAPTDASVNINNGAVYTNSRNVKLNLSATDDLAVTYVAASETTPIPDSTSAELYANEINFSIASPGDGTKTVYVQYADSVFNLSPEVSDSIILDTSIAIPTNATASLSGNTITVNWDAILGDLSGIAGYNVYSSSDGFANKINSSLITATTYNDVIKTNGSYSYKIEAVDNAGNISAKSAESVPVISAGNIVPSAPSNVKLTNSDKNLTVSWDAVSGVAGYIVTINDVSRDVGNAVTYSTDLADYGTYKVLVTSYYSADNFGINDSAGLKEAKKAAIAAGLEKSITISSGKTATVSEASVAPETAAAADTTTVTTPSSSTDTTDNGLQPEDQGQVKGEEQSTETSEEKINWTPWIILFVLIILAGAATGGYFYWFSGEDEVETKVKTKPEVEKKETTKPKAKNSSSKKPRRW